MWAVFGFSKQVALFYPRRRRHALGEVFYYTMVAADCNQFMVIDTCKYGGRMRILPVYENHTRRLLRSTRRTTLFSFRGHKHKVTTEVVSSETASLPALSGSRQ